VEEEKLTKLGIQDLDIVPLEDKPEKGTFGTEEKDEEYEIIVGWFKRFAWPTRRERGTKTFMIHKDSELVGFFTIAYGQLKFPESKVDSQVLILAQFYVCKTWRSRGIGKVVIGLITGVALKANDLIACRGVIAHSNPNPDTVRFYANNGFINLGKREDSTETMWLPIEAIPEM
jgi:GNAT superfamily N-acetyltransferase